MSKRFLLGITTLAVMAIPAFAQTVQRRADIAGGGSPDRGKCSVAVVVDGAAELDIRGDMATVRNLKGQMPQIRRFECSGRMPNDPAEFRFARVGGRGSQELVRDPRNGGVAGVHIEDPENGAGEYTFDLIWGGQPPEDRNRTDLRGPGDRNDRDRRPRFSADDAMRSCQEAVRQVAVERFDAREIAFRRVEATDNPGQRDSVNGVFDSRRDGREEAFRFTCSVDFDNGRVWDAQVEPFDRDRGDRDRRDR